MTDYSKEWREYRRLRNLAGGIWISVLLFGASTVFLGSLQASHAVSVVAVSVLGILVFSAAIVAAIRVEGWRCPRCGRPFVSRWWSRFAVFFATDCANCGLRKWSNG